MFKIKATNIPIVIRKMTQNFGLNPKLSICFLIKSSTTNEKKPMSMYTKMCLYL